MGVQVVQDQRDEFLLQKTDLNQQIIILKRELETAQNKNKDLRDRVAIYSGELRRLGQSDDVQAIRAYRTDFHLLDTHSERAPGGTGESFDWELARLHPSKPPLILSGGLTPDNVAQAIAAVSPFAVDTASGTEAEPGRKDPAKLTAFFRAVEADHVAA